MCIKSSLLSQSIARADPGNLPRSPLPSHRWSSTAKIDCAGLAISPWLVIARLWSVFCLLRYQRAEGTPCRVLWKFRRIPLWAWNASTLRSVWLVSLACARLAGTARSMRSAAVIFHTSSVRSDGLHTTARLSVFKEPYRSFHARLISMQCSSAHLSSCDLEPVETHRSISQTSTPLSTSILGFFGIGW